VPDAVSWQRRTAPQRRAAIVPTNDGGIYYTDETLDELVAALH
jgi:hypothetical protein